MIKKQMDVQFRWFFFSFVFMTVRVCVTFMQGINNEWAESCGVLSIDLAPSINNPEGI